MIATTKTIVAGYIFELNLPTLDGNPVNGNPSVHLIVTQDYDFGGTPPTLADPHQIGIWYDSSTTEWTIYNEDRAPIPAGAEFNVSSSSRPSLSPLCLQKTSHSSLGLQPRDEWPFLSRGWKDGLGQHAWGASRA